ncbi:MAG: DNA-directed RNA polymerase subunit beta, partial [Patescibacteria group bacterium]
MPRTKKSKPRIISSTKTRDVLVGKQEFQLDTLNLIEVQKKSWKFFLETSLEKIITEFFPIDDYTGKKFTLHYEGLYFGDSRYPLDVCIRKKLTFDVPVYIKLRIVNKKTGSERKQEVYFFNLPKMTDKGTFIINGIERVVINQLVRSPGVFFTAVIDKTTGLTLYNAEIRPYIGAWLDITISKNNLIEVKINKKRKFLVSTLIKAFEGESKTDILNHFKDLDKTLVEKYLLPTIN